MREHIFERIQPAVVAGGETFNDIPIQFQFRTGQLFQQSHGFFGGRGGAVLMRAQDDLQFFALSALNERAHGIQDRLVVGLFVVFVNVLVIIVPNVMFFIVFIFFDDNLYVVGAAAED